MPDMSVTNKYVTPGQQYHRGEMGGANNTSHYDNCSVLNVLLADGQSLLIDQKTYRSARGSM